MKKSLEKLVVSTLNKFRKGIKMSLLVSTAVLSCYTLFDCSNPTEPKNWKFAEKTVNNINYSLETNKDNYKLAESVDMLYRVTNRQGNPIEIGQVPNCEYGYCKYTIEQNSKEVWVFLRAIPPCGFTTFNLGPYETREFKRTWDQMNDNGTSGLAEDDFPVGPGTYKIKGQLDLYNASKYESVPVSVYIKINND